MVDTPSDIRRRMLGHELQKVIDDLAYAETRRTIFSARKRAIEAELEHLTKESI